MSTHGYWLSAATLNIGWISAEYAMFLNWSWIVNKYKKQLKQRDDTIKDLYLGSDGVKNYRIWDKTTSFMDDPSGLCMALLYTAAFVWNKGQKRPIGLHATIVFRMPPNSRVFSLISSFTCTVYNFRWNRKGNPCISYFILVLNFAGFCVKLTVSERERLGKLVRTCPKLTGIVQTCLKLFKFVQTCSKLVLIGQNLSKLVETCPNLTMQAKIQSCFCLKSNIEPNTESKKFPKIIQTSVPNQVNNREAVETCQDLSKLVWNCSNVSKLVIIGWNLL